MRFLNIKFVVKYVHDTAFEHTINLKVQHDTVFQSTKDPIFKRRIEKLLIVI